MATWFSIWVNFYKDDLWVWNSNMNSSNYEIKLYSGTKQVVRDINYQYHNYTIMITSDKCKKVICTTFLTTLM